MRTSVSVLTKSVICFECATLLLKFYVALAAKTPPSGVRTPASICLSLEPFIGMLPAALTLSPGVATSSIIYLLLNIIMILNAGEKLLTNQRSKHDYRQRLRLHAKHNAN